VSAYGCMPVVAVMGFGGGATPSALVTLRGVVAVVVLGVVCALTKQIRRIAAVPALGLLALCGPLFGLQVVAFFSSVQHGGAQLAVVVAHIYPLLVIGLVWVRDREPISPWLAPVSFVILLGLVMVTASGGALPSSLPVGLALISAVGYALYLVISEHWVHRVGTLRATGLVTAGATTTVGIYALFSEEHFALSWSGWHAVLIQGLLLIPVGLGGGLYAVRRLGAVPIGMLGILEPVVAVCLAAILLSERLTAFQWVGVVLILAACAMVPYVTTRQRKQDPRSTR